MASFGGKNKWQEDQSETGLARSSQDLSFLRWIIHWYEPREIGELIVYSMRS